MASKAIPSHAGPPGKPAAAPSATLYLRNLNDKLRKSDLQKELYYLFTTYGRVLDVNVMPGPKMRGQAHIVYPDVQVSTQAMRELQGFNFHGRDLKIEYGKNRSQIFNKLEGEYKTTEDEKKEGHGAIQQSVFEAPRPGQASLTTTTKSTPGSADKFAERETSQGVKRPREEEEDGDEDAPAGEDEDEDDEDDDVEMEESDDDE